MKQLTLTRLKLCLLGLLCLLWPLSVQAQPPEAEDSLETLFNSLSIDEKIGQLFIVPFEGDQVGPNSDIGILIGDYKVGGVVLQASNANFSNNSTTPQSIANLNNRLQEQALSTGDVPLLIAIDQEGDGWPYTRITGGTTPLPSPMSIGATWNPENARDVGRIVGREMSAMGVNMLLGPVVDVLNDPRPTGRGDVGTRTFGGDPFWVAQMGLAYVEGIHEGSQGRLATVSKHFPGHGGSDRLPDNEVATVDKSLGELKRIELAPFFALTEVGNIGTTDAMMSSHIRYRGFQGDIRQFTAPISFDQQGMQTLLNLPEFVPWRSAGGLIVSDALGVPAVRKHYDPTLQTFPHRRIAREAFLAGNDILILAQFDLRSIWSEQFTNIKDTIEYFRTEYRNNPEFAQQVDQSVRRVLQLKLNLYPSLSPNSLFVDGDVALAVAGQGQSVVDRIARESLTLLHPTPAEYTQRLARPPQADETLLIVSDVRQVRECFRPDCLPFEPLAYTAVEDLILQLYGPDSTRQVVPENINSISFTELKQVLSGSLAQIDPTPAPDPAQAEAPPTEPQNPLRPPEEVTNLIQGADWIVFLQLDLNTERYPNSDALRLFLAQGIPSLSDKNLIVFALNSPYYLDTTEINKLTAYFGLYSKTEPHLEVAVRTLFGESQPQGASPVNVDGINYDLTEALSPDPIRSFPVQVLSTSPSNRLPPVTVTVQAGPILDHNGNLVPDGTPVEFRPAYPDGSSAQVPLVTTINGVAETTLLLTEPGAVEIQAFSGQAQGQRPQVVTVMAPPTPTPTATATPSPTPTATTTPTPQPTPTERPTATPSPTATPTVAVSPTPLPPIEPPASPNPQTTGPSVNLTDFFLAVGIVLLANGAVIWFRRQTYATLTRQVRLVLVAFIGGMIAYLLYGVGWVRPELWLWQNPAPWLGRLMLTLLVLLAVWIAIVLDARTEQGG